RWKSLAFADDPLLFDGCGEVFSTLRILSIADITEEADLQFSQVQRFGLPMILSCLMVAVRCSVH
ncbi:hypothetical protein J6590_064331, partial [Homalodisca vitripennis]